MKDTYTNASLGRYQIGERIGAGGMARVYKAQDSNLGRTVAIKILHDYLAEDETFKERFEREARFIAGFNHPNIVQIYDYDVVDRGDHCVYYMVMPYISGRTLRDLLEETHQSGQRLSWGRVAAIMRQLGGALGYAHDRGMIHRDVKPGNILFNERDEAVLTDFGIARLLAGSRLTQDGAATGTPAYMSPEQVTGQRVDARSDIYALGIIAFEMLAGRLPYDNETGISIMFEHIRTPIPAISSFLDEPNPQLDAFFQKALAKSIDDRFPTTQAFTNALSQIIDGTTPAVPPLAAITTETRIFETPPHLATDPQPARQNPISPLIILAAGMTIIALVIGVALINTRPSPANAAPTALPRIVDDGVPSMTSEEALYFNSTFNPSSLYNNYWPQGDSDMIGREITPDGFYRFTNNRISTAVTSIFEPMYIYGDAVITMEGWLDAETDPASAFGIVFRYQDADNYNVFAVDGAGRFSIWVRENGVWRELRADSANWTPSEAVLGVGQNNRLMLEIGSGWLVGYVNDVMVAQVIDDTFSSGAIGIYLATSSAGSATAWIDSYRISAVARGAPSMTSDRVDTTPTPP